jgi:hypothetical protein
MKSFLILSSLLLNAIAFAQSDAQTFVGCDPSPTPLIASLQVDENQTVMATICRQGDDVIVTTSQAVPKSNLIYFGVNAGLPFFGYEFTYSRLKNGELHYHLSLGAEGSLGGSAASLRAGFHPMGNAVFVGGKASVMNNAHGVNEFLLGPTVGLSGGRRFVTGHIGLSLLADYNPKYQVVNPVPELVMGVRLRLFRFGK